MVCKRPCTQTGFHRARTPRPATEAQVNSIGEQRLALEHGFQPAYFDFLTQTIYPSVFADGTPAPFHILEGLPEEVVVDRARSGRVVTTKASLLTGYERNGFFYTKPTVARAIVEWTCRLTPDLLEEEQPEMVTRRPFSA